MNEEERKALMEDFRSIVDESLETNVKEIVGEEATARVKEVVQKMRLERALYGRDASGLGDETKIALVNDIKAIIKGEKAALLEDSDTAGGYLVPTEIHQGIMRVAETVGLVSRDAMRLPMATDEMDVPRYTGSALTGDYLGEDEVGSETTVTFGDAKLNAKTWYTLFRVGNTLLADANVDVADWLIGLVAEGLSARLDKEAFQGGTFAGSPFVGALGSADVTVYTMASGATTFASFTPDMGSDMIANVEESLLNDCAFYMHRTVWAKIRQTKDTAGNYIVGQNNSMISANFKKDGIKPAGVLWDYPVYTTNYLPANSATAVSTKFLVFGNLRKGILVGDRQNLTLAKSDSATVGGKNVFATNQTAIRATHRHAISIGLPSALVIAKTAAS